MNTNIVSENASKVPYIGKAPKKRRCWRPPKPKNGDLTEDDVNRLAPKLGTAAEPRNETPHEATGNEANFAFWEAFMQWCHNNGKVWCRFPVSPRGNSYYDPNHDPIGSQRENGWIFFTINENRSGNIRNVGPLVTIGIYCAAGEEQRGRIRRLEPEFTEAFAADAVDFTDWTSGRADGGAKRILFIRKVDYRDRNGREELFSRMAEDYERISRVLQKMV